MLTLDVAQPRLGQLPFLEGSSWSHGETPRSMSWLLNPRRTPRGIMPQVSLDIGVDGHDQSISLEIPLVATLGVIMSG